MAAGPSSYAGDFPVYLYAVSGVVTWLSREGQSLLKA